jgi:hypothetical protein
MTSFKKYNWLNERMLNLRNLCLVGILVCFAADVCAQMRPFLLLEKPGTTKRFRYYTGDEIIFKMRSGPDFLEAIIVGFNDSTFFVGNWAPIALSEVEALADRSKVPGVKKISASALGTIPVFFLLSAGNNFFNTDRRPIIDPEIWALSAVFAGIGTAGLFYKGRRYRLDNRWRILVIHH